MESKQEQQKEAWYLTIAILSEIGSISGIYSKPIANMIGKLTEQIDDLYNSPTKAETQPVVCPKADECGDECFYPDHKTPHADNWGCTKPHGSKACPACIPVSQPETPDELLTDEGLELTVARILADCDSLTEVSDSVWELYRREAKEIISKCHQSEVAIRAEYEKKIKKLELKIKESTEFKDKAFLYMNQVAIPRAEEEAIADERKKIVSIVLSHVEAESGLPPRWVAELIFKLMRC